MQSMAKHHESEAERSSIMARVKSKDTGPEKAVRRQVFSLGYRYRLHVAELPGKPDMVFHGRHKVIFINGCFWHGHHCRAGQNRPASNVAYWSAKLERNAARDVKNLAALKSQGWKALVVWECETQNKAKLEKRVVNFLSK